MTKDGVAVDSDEPAGRWLALLGHQGVPANLRESVLRLSWAILAALEAVPARVVREEYGLGDEVRGVAIVAALAAFDETRPGRRQRERGDDKLWCRGVLGQKHAAEYVLRVGQPDCQPLRPQMRRVIEQALDAAEARGQGGQALAFDTRRLAEGWECFHRSRCGRCRRNLKAFLFADQCPVAQGVEPPGEPGPFRLE